MTLVICQRWDWCASKEGRKWHWIISSRSNGGKMKQKPPKLNQIEQRATFENIFGLPKQTL